MRCNVIGLYGGVGGAFGMGRAEEGPTRSQVSDGSLAFAAGRRVGANPGRSYMVRRAGGPQAMACVPVELGRKPM